MPGKRNLTIEEAFWSKVKTGDGCWEWTGNRTKNHKGEYVYGILCFVGIHWLAHRLSYVIHVGPIPEGTEIDHVCRNVLCVNPSHLEAVTHTTNMRRGSLATAQFCKRGHARNGPGTHCEECIAIVKTEWNIKNAERNKENKKKHYLANREAALQRARNQRERNRVMKHV